MNIRPHLYVYVSVIALLLFICANPLYAITISSSPVRPTVNQPVTLTITSTYTATPSCDILVDFGDDSGQVSAGTCFVTPCVQVLTHTYTVPGQYTIIAGENANFCRVSPGGPNPATLQINVQAVCAPMSITTSSPLPPGSAGQPYTAQINISGGYPPVSLFQISGDLPPGLSMNTSGRISGTPLSGGTFSFTIMAEDACPNGKQSAQRTFSLYIDQAVTMGVTVLPSSFTIGRGAPTTKSITFTISSSSLGNVELTSSIGLFMAGENVVGEIHSPLNISITNGSGRITESIYIPIAVIKRTENLGVAKIAYQRIFSGQSLSATARSNITITTDAGAEFRISSTRLFFENNRPEITISSNQPLPELYAEIRHTGTGLLKGYWEVDGKIFSNVFKHIPNVDRTIITSPSMPSFPTFDPGTHVVRFIITSPRENIDFPKVIYFVKPVAHTKRLPIKLVLPQDNSSLKFTSGEFKWEETNAIKSTTYLIEFRNMIKEKAIFSAYTTKKSYRVSDDLLEKYFKPNQNYLWSVIGFDSDDEIHGVSNPFKFFFMPRNSK
ncbi:hypothetical protein SAMN02746065_1119 [Desulfocicer vacuolatum DSM 3385]|uniref:Uncharacterized protein n=1 Tax=Desulfocicer vacuolatum DSM 3385 TaxID=1121400 RepID=A0A1W2C7U7_9BACT|nr:putative Ig domain-containing protein [Desulfocicer vacuolatum]SMC80932.1 hypothetical protein SAMN02746065_1119 [Desulfocicer vacuolatum DSM 3385]